MKAIFFPKSELPIKICPNRHGAAMTYTEQTDSIRTPSRYAVEYYAHKHGAAVGAFIDPIGSQLVDIKESEKYGACKFDIYFYTDSWYNPNTGNLEIIPDYNASAWTQNGINTFGYVEGGVTKINGVAVAVGTAKGTRAPNHGTQMFDYSNGKYGWKNGKFGATNGIEQILYQKYNVDWFKGLTGRFPSAMSYRNGQTGGQFTDIAFYLQNRNSSTGMWNDTANAPTWYGKDSEGNPKGVPTTQEVTRTALASRPSTTRWWDWIDNISGGTTFENSINGVKAIVALTVANGGWQNNFTHWHSSGSTAKEELKLKCYDAYFAAIQEAANGAFIHFCNYGEASDYLIFRQCVDNIAAYSKGNRIVVSVCIIDPYSGDKFTDNGLSAKLPEQRVINTPLSVEVDLTGTYLEGKNVKTNFGKAIKGEGNKVIVEIPFSKNNEGIMQIEIYDNVLPDWKVTSQPIFSNFNENSGVVNFNTDCPCYSCVFEITDENNIALVQRNIEGDMKKTHTFTFSKKANKTYAVGIINECGLTNLKDIS